MIRLIIFLIGTIIAALASWLGLAKITYLQEQRILLLILRFIFLIPLAVLMLIIISYIFIMMPRSAPPVPQITYGEFPFKLEYEVDDEHFVIEDTFISEFDRSIGGNGITPSGRRWNSGLLSGKSLNENENSDLLLKELEDISIIFSPGSSTYYMGDPDCNSIRCQPVIIIRNPANTSLLTYIRPEDAHEILIEYGITLIDWKYTPPIENAFK
jgi:hypothetical protein